jgi:DNA-binding NarL/FixJ family response regulator
VTDERSDIRGVSDGSDAGSDLSDERVRVLVVDDQRLIRESIASLLDIQPGIRVIGTAGDGREAVEQVLSLGPDVVLMDVRMPTMDGIEAVTILSQRAPDCHVIMLTTFDDEEYVVRALRAGARGYLLKDRPAQELAAAVRLAHAGVVQFDPAAAARLTAVLSRRPPESWPGTEPAVSGSGRSDPASLGRERLSRSDTELPGPELTAREVEVLRLVATGSTNREIAQRLYLSEGTVKNHISKILGRLGLRDRTQAAIYARDHDLL